MKLTRGEFCQFNTATRVELIREFGKNVFIKKIRMKVISVYKLCDFYVEVFENAASRRVERVEPVINPALLEVYQAL